MPEHVFINLNLAIVEFCVCRGKGSRDTVTNLPACVYQNHENGLFHRLTAPYLIGISKHTYTPL